ncbi:S-adenosyl-L-methionine-dependent methyltransferase [Trichoderma citrinoviride]|uniref:S-adenosyl-L-methionine-dependent methyltransferase n=1 Tax=Trichoderma citrinoviride TaxID=58853 RepID=A0A2T4B6W3_9HYPO|nr:S-adenosyl-L-methionine-dependent methyltransferase [Trichoderma citrinoviride]PTB64969.1 S-adenosyl-L-methionine-dependent methyltransferase [Trichoderma citrinoviride]
MPQYDSIGASYNVLEELPYRAVEKHNVYTAINPLLKPGARVLEVACGTGFYSSHLLTWGAGYVMGMDISSTMLESAVTRLSSEIASGKAQFMLGDGAIPQSFAPDNSSGFFSMVFGAWFLNYASSKEDLVAMFTNISLNLEPGGVFVGVVPHPTDDIQKRAEDCKQDPLRQYYPRNEYVEELASGDGWSLRVSLNEGGLDIMTWHMRKSVYEEAARMGGLRGKLEWRYETLGEESAREQFGLTADEWSARVTNPHLGILIAWKD